MAEERKPTNVADTTPVKIVLPDLVLGELYIVERNGHRGKALLVELDGEELQVPDEPELDGVKEVKMPVKTETTPKKVEPKPVPVQVVEQPAEVEATPETVEEVEEPEEFEEEIDESEEDEENQGKTISLKEKYPQRTFEQRLYDAGEELRERYSEIKNEFLSFRKVKARRTQACETFRHGYDIIGKVVVAGKGLKVYLALDPMSVDSAIYHQRDASSKKRFTMVPLVVKVRTDLAVRKAKTLIDMACEGKDTQKKARYTIVDYSNPEQKDVEDDD
jgi:hypothetical protein